MCFVVLPEFYVFFTTEQILCQIVYCLKVRRVLVFPGCKKESPLVPVTRSRRHRSYPSWPGVRSVTTVRYVGSRLLIPFFFVKQQTLDFVLDCSWDSLSLLVGCLSSTLPIESTLSFLSDGAPLSLLPSHQYVCLCHYDQIFTDSQSDLCPQFLLRVQR